MDHNALLHVPGYRAAAVACGIKATGRLDLSAVLSEHPCTAAAVFTQNGFPAAPVVYDRAVLLRTGGQGLRALVINSGNANACTGPEGDRDAEQMARWFEQKASLPVDSVLVMSTGIIGQRLPMPVIHRGLEEIVVALPDDMQGGARAAQAIMTTDTYPKTSLKTVALPSGKTITIGGMSKGSGMIHPDMATMLGVVVTDAAIEVVQLQTALKAAVDASFNCISVDGDTSTNDTVAVLARSPGPDNPPLSEADQEAFNDGLTELCLDLAKMIVRDGEGATKLVEVRVRGGRSKTDATRVARVLAVSPLVKTAIFGNDPNWGRFVMAIGRSGAEVCLETTSINLRIASSESPFDVPLLSGGTPVGFDNAMVRARLESSNELTLDVDLGLGTSVANYWTCDLSYGYVEINAEYTT
ncbi:MAG: bifunctional glutamate N-acetyltransferase/amino-acid acetyltransferase ArgJ [Myxococcales bacterium]|nr:bifunctional glutamate N-acetyltransferase/amino-acid acetyltransferase ArgJ [Myxococcales bacterium]